MIADSIHGYRESTPPLESGLSVVVPVFNSEQIIADLVGELSDTLELTGLEFEIVLVNDGSEDRSWQEIDRMAHVTGRVRGIDLSRNFGQHNATLCGLREARFDVCVTMDDDLQHPPSEISKLVERLDEGWDVVYGLAQERRHSWIRNLLTRWTKAVVGRVSGQQRILRQSPFRALRTELREAFAAYCGPDVLLDVLLGWGTSRFNSVVVEHHPRRRGSSTYTVRRLFEMGLLALTAYSTLPLRFASWLGFALTAFGVAILIYVFVLAIFIGSVPGFPFLASLISIFSGTQLFTLGLFGEYLTRVFNRALGRPTYVIRTTTTGSAWSESLPR
jgi:undecaprenyl-phosphate 4-deoxy-4-formamido-L-arabinose transferase